MTVAFECQCLSVSLSVYLCNSQSISTETTETVGDCLLAGLSLEDSQWKFIIFFWIPPELIEHFSLHCWLCSHIWSENVEGLTLLSAWIQMHYCTRHSLRSNTHKLINPFWEDSRVTMRQGPQSKFFSVSVFKSIYFWQIHPKETSPYLGPVCFSRTRGPGIPDKEFYADRSDMTNFSILFPISPGTWSSSDS